jgi:undecaprenyl diphosphate synthase
MDGNGRWAIDHGLERTEGHKVGEKALMDVIAGGIDAGVQQLSFYTFSTENWNRSPSEVRFLMGFSREIIHQRTDLLNDWGVKIQWCGRKPKLWGSVYRELMRAQERTRNNRRLVLNMCINYGGRNEIVDAVNLAIQSGQSKITQRGFQKFLYQPETADVDMLIRTGGELRVSNFLLYQIAYAELFFSEKNWPDYRREDLWQAIVEYGQRSRTYGK